MTQPSVPLPDPRAEAVRVLEAAREAGIELRATGGVAVYLRCPSAHQPPLARDYKDIDLAGRAGDAAAIGALMSSLGYSPDSEFNALHGHQRLFFWDPANERQLDVFIEKISMCHQLTVGDRLAQEEVTLSLVDLLLTKLQVVELNEKDLKDAAALLADHEIGARGIDPHRFLEVVTTDWGWWRTSTETLRRVTSYVRGVDSLTAAETIERRADELLRRAEVAPKSLRWKLRARVGDRVRWYEEPEEVEG